MKLVELAFFSDDVDQTAAFYRHLLGKAPDVQGDGMAIFLLGDTKIFIHRSYPPAEGELPPEDHLAFKVEDVDAACQQLIDRGLKFEHLPRDYYWGRSAYLRAPNGTQIEITQE
ncbi:MAG: VOC family protein [Anaerolineales bacterium]|nr:MAG: VOC family protein [Anaerolineales bacterium]